MPFQPSTTFHMRAVPTIPSGRTYFSSTSLRNSASNTTTTTTTTPATAAQNPGFLRRLAATPRGRAGLVAAAVVGGVIDYELWTLYRSGYFGGRKTEQ